jgi:hypothetical protein
MAYTSVDTAFVLPLGGQVGSQSGSMIVELSPIIPMPGVSVTYTPQTINTITGVLAVFSGSTAPLTAAAPLSISWSGTTITAASATQSQATGIQLLIFGTMQTQ